MKEKREGSLEKNSHLPPQPIEGEIVLGVHIPKDRDAPPFPTSPNGQVAEERKTPNPSEKKEPIEKENILGNHQKDKIAYIPLDPVTDYIYIADLNTRLRVG